MATEAAATPQPSDPRYVDLGKNYPDWSSWSNDPADLSLNIYFTPEAPNLASDFNLAGLKPIIVELDEGDGRGDTFLLTDDSQGYYIWNEADGRMFKYKQTLKLEEVVYKVRSGIDWADLVQQFDKDFRVGPQGDSARGG